MTAWRWEDCDAEARRSVAMRLGNMSSYLRRLSRMVSDPSPRHAAEADAIDALLALASEAERRT